MYKVIVIWKDYVGMDPFVYEAETRKRANEIAARQRLRPESLVVRIEEVPG